MINVLLMLQVFLRNVLKITPVHSCKERWGNNEKGNVQIRPLTTNSFCLSKQKQLGRINPVMMNENQMSSDFSCGDTKIVWSGQTSDSHWWHWLCLCRLFQFILRMGLAFSYWDSVVFNQVLINDSSRYQMLLLFIYFYIKGDVEGWIHHLEPNNVLVMSTNIQELKLKLSWDQ